MPDTEKYCDVCKAELKIGPTIKFAAFGDEEENEQVLCPICKRNYMDPNDDMCSECKENRNSKALEPEQDVDPENDEEWRNYLDEDEKEAISNKTEEGEEILSLSQLEEDEARELFDDEEEEDTDFYDNDVDDDFDYPVADAADFEDYDDEENVDEDDEF